MGEGGRAVWLSCVVALVGVGMVGATEVAKSGDVLFVHDEGVFAVVSASAPGTAAPDQPAHVAYWRALSTNRVYVYMDLIESDTDMGQALLALRADFGISPESFADHSKRLAGAIESAGDLSTEPAVWQTGDQGDAGRVDGLFVVRSC